MKLSAAQKSARIVVKHVGTFGASVRTIFVEGVASGTMPNDCSGSVERAAYRAALCAYWAAAS